MVHGLASQLGGSLAIESLQAAGAIVKLWLPQSIVAVAGAQAPEPVTLTASGRVLLADDETLVRIGAADILCDLGYDVFEADTAEGALGLIEVGRSFDLLFTDHLMPEMNGTDLVRQVRNMRPGMPALISGYAESAALDPDLPRLTKPFRNEELAASLVQITGRAL